jgi:hypothetical protein
VLWEQEAAGSNPVAPIEFGPLFIGLFATSHLEQNTHCTLYVKQKLHKQGCLCPSASGALLVEAKGESFDFNSFVTASESHAASSTESKHPKALREEGESSPTTDAADTPNILKTFTRDSPGAPHRHPTCSLSPVAYLPSCTLQEMSKGESHPPKLFTSPHGDSTRMPIAFPPRAGYLLRSISACRVNQTDHGKRRKRCRGHRL